MTSERNGNSKVVWYILFAFITVVMLYLFTVVYFYFISPYNISLKIAFWPFVSQEVVEDMYLDATVEINFSVYDHDALGRAPVSVVGVNVREDGYIVAPYDEFRKCDELSAIEVKTNRNGVYSGKVVYADKDSNMALIKCENYPGVEKNIRIPFVSMPKTKKPENKSAILAVSSPLQKKTVWEGTVLSENVCEYSQTKTFEGREVVDFVVENCFKVDIPVVNDQSYEGGVVFDLKGNCYGLAVYSDGEYTVLPISTITMFLSNVAVCYKNEKTYKNNLLEKIVGFDQIELKKHIELSAKSNDDAEKEQFYFNGGWQTYTYDILHYANAQVNGYYLFADFVYGEAKIEADNFITAIKYHKKSNSIKTKIDLLEALYEIEKGDEITICYYPAETLEGLQSVTFVV